MAKVAPKSTARDTAPVRDAAQRVIPGEVVVKLTREARQEPGCLQRILAGLSAPARIESDVDRLGMALVRVEPADSDRLLEQLRQNDRIEFAEPNHVESGA